MGNETLTLEKIEVSLGKINQRFEAIDKRFEAIDKRFEAMDKRFDRMEDRFEKRFDTLAASVGSMEFDMREVKAELKHINTRYDATFKHLDDFLGRLSDQESESTLMKNEQNVIKSAMRARLSFDVDSPEFR